MSEYISSWERHTNGLTAKIRELLDAGHVSENDTVWVGPAGDAVVASDPAELDEEYAEYTDAGTVAEYLHDED
jgi:hypothetical protein